MKEWFIIAAHTSDDCLGLAEPTTDLKKALAIQLAMLIGCSVEAASAELNDEIVSDEIISDARNCLNKYGRYRIYNNEEEVYIFSIPAKEIFR